MMVQYVKMQRGFYVNKLLFVDCLRGFAILGVLLVHCGQVIQLPYFLASIANQGQTGVQLFFIASAFTIFLSYENRSLKGENNVVINFFIRRFFRIAPMFYVTMIVYLVINIALSKHSNEATFPNIFTHLLFINGWFPDYINTIIPGGWSVAVEMMFYLLVPLSYKYISTYNRAIVFSAITILLSLLQNIVFANFYDKNFIYFWLPNQLSIFSFGFIFYYLFKRKVKTIKFPVALSMLSMLGMITLSQFTSYVVNINHILYGLIFTVFAYSLSLQEKSIFVNNVIGYIGKISYSIYLVHFLILKAIGFIFKHFLNTDNPIYATLEFIIFYFTVVICAVAISSLSYKYVEKIGMSKGNSIISKLNINYKLSIKDNL